MLHCTPAGQVTCMAPVHITVTAASLGAPRRTPLARSSLAVSSGRASFVLFAFSLRWGDCEARGSAFACGLARRRSTCRRRTSRGPREEIRTRSRDAAERATGTTTFPGDVVMAFREYGALLRVWTRAGKVRRAGGKHLTPFVLFG